MFRPYRAGSESCFRVYLLNLFHRCSLLQWHTEITSPCFGVAKTSLFLQRRGTSAQRQGEVKHTKGEFRIRPPTFTHPNPLLKGERVYVIFVPAFVCFVGFISL